MMTSHLDCLNRKDVGDISKLLLEMTFHILNYSSFEPLVFCHDGGVFDYSEYSRVLLRFFNILLYLDSCGIHFTIDAVEPPPFVLGLYRHIEKGNFPMQSVVSYEIKEIDFLDMNIKKAIIPEKSKEEDFFLIKLYLLFRTGASLDRQAIERFLGRTLNNSEFKKLFRDIVCVTENKITKRKDNFYIMRPFDEK